MKPMMTAVLATLLVAAIPVEADAQSLSKQAVGTYETSGEYWQQLKVTRGKKAGQFRGAFEVATRGCQGDVAMTGTSSGKLSIRFSKTDDLVPGGVCNIDVRFSPDFKSATISHPYCGYSGAACDFNGTLKRVGK